MFKCVVFVCVCVRVYIYKCVSYMYECMYCTESVLHTLRTHLMHHTSHPVPAETGYWRGLVKWTGGT